MNTEHNSNEEAPWPSVKARVAAQKALLGMILPNLRMVTIREEEAKVTMWFVYDGPLTDLQFALAKETTDQLKLELGQNCEVSHQVIRIDTPLVMDEVDGFMIFYSRRTQPCEHLS